MIGPGRFGSRPADRGAAVIEAALLLPILILLLTGMVEYGLSWSTSNSVSDAVGSATFDLSRGYADRPADLRVIEQLRAAPGEIDLDEIDWVIVYRSNANDGAPPAACVSAAEALTSGSGGVTGTCNAYHGSAVATLTAGDFGDSSCAGDPDEAFCPANRKSELQPGDGVGVAIRVSHSWVTGMLPGPGLTMTDHSLAIPID